MLSSVDEVLAHAGVYDPAARRERYLRNRELKGRAPGQTDDAGGDPAGNGNSSGPSSVPVTQVNAAASATRQVAALKARLASLQAALQKLLADAESSSSSETSSSSTKKGGSETKDGPEKPKTAKQKAAAKEALKEAQKERAKEADKKPDEPTKEEKIAKLRATISDVQSKLRAALERARNQTASNGR